jgi:endonuclease YncB( thermonuclease family)
MPRRTLCLLLLVLPLSAQAETLTGKVVGVTDGDTITVLVAEHPIKVRLAEIDTPERGQPWASRAKQALSDKVFGKEVEIRVVTVDRYGRTVAPTIAWRFLGGLARHISLCRMDEPITRSRAGSAVPRVSTGESTA